MEKLKINLLIVPKFELGDMSGDNIGEARLFYERYCVGAEKYDLRGGYTLHVNAQNGAALGVTNMGKANAILFMTAALSDVRFDFSEAYILSVGCAGSACGVSTMGDVVIVRETVDYDLGFQSVESDGEGGFAVKWFGNASAETTAHKKLNSALAERCFEMTRSLDLETTAVTRRTLERNFPGEKWALRLPKVLTGTSVSSDTYWKGIAEHRKAQQIAEFFNCAEPYTVTEMEDNACAVAADTFGMLSRLIILRASVNVDVLLDGATAETTWGSMGRYEEAVNEDNGETLDIFVPAMRNLLKVGSVIADAVLDGTLL